MNTKPKKPRNANKEPKKPRNANKEPKKPRNTTKETQPVEDGGKPPSKRRRIDNTDKRTGI